MGIVALAACSLTGTAFLPNVLAAASASAAAPVCRSGETGCGSDAVGGEHFWPGAFGDPRRYGSVPWPQPTNMSSQFSWRWHHPQGKAMDMPIGAVIDRNKDIYVTADQAVYKFSPDGEIIWMHKSVSGTGNGPALVTDPVLGDSLIADTFAGHFYALDTSNGQLRWITHHTSEGICGDTGFVTVHAGRIVSGTRGPDGCRSVSALNVTDGSALWTYYPDVKVWDLMVQFPDDETCVFQDFSGTMYRLSLTDGALIWKNGGQPHSWTDGTQFLGPNGIVYGTSNMLSGISHPGPDLPGKLSAYRLDDGKLLWEVTTPMPPNTSPVVGRLGPGSGLSVVMPIGQQCPDGCAPPALRIFDLPLFTYLPFFLQMKMFHAVHSLSLWLGESQSLLWRNQPLPNDVYVYDAESGAFQWKWEGPVYRRMQDPGEEEHYIIRRVANRRTACCPTPWSAPRIGIDGTIYVGNQNGVFYAFRDANGDGQIDDATEVSSYDTGGTFSATGSAHAPGLIVIAGCDGVFAWKS